MAARHLQRLRAAATEKLDDEQPSSEEELVAERAPFNPFDLLSDEEVILCSLSQALMVNATASKGSQDGGSLLLRRSTLDVFQAGPAAADEEEDDDEGNEKLQNHTTPSMSHTQSSSAAKKGRKPKKKKKKGALHTEGEDAGAQKAAAQDDEDLDKILSDLNIQTVRK